MCSARVDAPEVSGTAPERTRTGVDRRRLPWPAVSIRLRLTLLYTAVLALALTLFGGALYLRVAQTTRDAAGQVLITEATSLIPALRGGGEGPMRGEGLPGRLFPPPNFVMTAPDTYFQMRYPNGQLMPSQPLPAAPSPLPLTSGDLQRLVQGHDIAPQDAIVGSIPILLYTVPVIGFDLHAQVRYVAGVLQVARPLRDVNAPLDDLRPTLLVGALTAIVLAFGGGWLLAGTALRPISRLTETARSIGEARDFGRRVEHDGPRDEVGRLATTFNTMLAGLQESYLAQRRFVADASHELRTPLTSIRGNLGLLQRDPPITADDRVAVLSDLVSESERLSRLVADLLTLARSDAGRSLQRVPVAIAPLLAELAPRLSAASNGRGFTYQASQDAVVVGDRDALMQVLVILLDNALKFTPLTGTITVTVEMGEDSVATVVRDTGEGIAPDALPRIFERFYQGDTARAGSGTGLGLSIAKVLIEALDGTISVESTPGSGSTFTFTLPRAAAPRDPERLPDVKVTPGVLDPAVPVPVPGGR